jgi:hypothetical protein
VRYFGLFTKRMCDNLEKEGVSREQAISGALELFGQGLSIEVVTAMANQPDSLQ